MGTVKSFPGGLQYDWDGLANVPEALKNTPTGAAVGQILEVTKVDSTGKILEVKAVDKPAGGNGDATAPDWVATKTVTGNDTVHIPEQKLTTGIWNNLQTGLQVGDTYDVTFNGEVYTCEARTDDGAVALGNNSDMTANDYPFCVLWAGGGATSGMFFKRSDISYPITLKVAGHISVIYDRMPEEYLPDCVVKSVNGVEPDSTGNVKITIPNSSQNVDLTGYAKEQWVQEGFQPKGNYLTEVPEGYAKSEDIPTKPEDIGAQPKGDYLTAVPAGYATEEFVKNKIAEAELGGEEVDLSGYAQKSELPTKVSQLQNDSGYLTEHQDISGKLDASALPTAIDTALAQAKASGEFDGKDGKDGQDGYTPKKGVDYFDGENGQDGSPGKDGNDGQPGKDGTSPVISVSAITGGHRITITDANGTKTVDVMDGSDGKNGADGQPGADGSPGQDGQNGSDGVGIASIKQTTTSTADGGDNVFTVTLTNGTSATFTVKNGSKGSTGATGAAGKDGNTSVKIMTKAEYSALIQENVEQMYSNGIRLVIVEDGYTNLVPKATDATGNVYRGCGYLDGYRLTSSGDLSAQGNTCVSGFMPYNHGSTIRIVGSCGDTLSNGGQYVGVYDANYGVIQIAYPSNLVNNGVATWEPRADGLWELTIDTSKIAAWSGAKYFRASCVMCVGADLVVTKNEPIGLEV